MKKTIMKYGLMHVPSGEMVGYRTISNGNGDCVDIQYILDLSEKDRLWLVDDPEHAEYVRLHSTEWYNAEYDSPNHSPNCKPEELKVVKYMVSIESEDVEVSIPTFPEYIKLNYADQPDHRDDVLSEWEQAGEKERQRTMRYSLYDLRNLRYKQKEK